MKEYLKNTGYMYRVDRKTKDFQMMEGTVKSGGVDARFIPAGERFARFTIAALPGEVKGGKVWFFQPDDSAAADALTAYYKERQEGYIRLIANLQEKIDILTRRQI